MPLVPLVPLVPLLLVLLLLLLLVLILLHDAAPLVVVLVLVGVVVLDHREGLVQVDVAPARQLLGRAAGLVRLLAGLSASQPASLCATLAQTLHRVVQGPLAALARGDLVLVDDGADPLRPHVGERPSRKERLLWLDAHDKEPLLARELLGRHAHGALDVVRPEHRAGHGHCVADGGLDLVDWQRALLGVATALVQPRLVRIVRLARRPEPDKLLADEGVAKFGKDVLGQRRHHARCPRVNGPAAGAGATLTQSHGHDLAHVERARLRSVVMEQPLARQLPSGAHLLKGIVLHEDGVVGVVQQGSVGYVVDLLGQRVQHERARLCNGCVDFHGAPKGSVGCDARLQRDPGTREGDDTCKRKGHNPQDAAAGWLLAATDIPSF